MSFFSDVATPLIQRGVPVVPLRSKTKIAFLPNWEELASTDPVKIAEWDAQYPDSNCGSVAKASSGSVWFFEFDSPEVGQRCGDETHQKLPDTFKVRSSPGKGHIYFRQSPASIAMGNIAQGFVKGEDWSARVDRQYVVSPGSLHPKTGLPYEIRSLAPIVEAPQWFIDWCISQKVDKKRIASADGEEPISESARNDSLTSIGGGLRHKGLTYEEILTVLTRINETRCNPPLPESEVETIAASVSRYAPGRPNILLVGGKVAGVEISPASVMPVEDPTVILAPPYPKFPEWAMKGTSVYEGLVKPFCDVNSRYPEFMFMPAVTIMLNYLGTRVRVKGKDIIPSIFMVSIGRAGRVIKSSCVQDAIKYFEFMGLAGYGDQEANNANGRSMVFTPASPEGLGKEMKRLNCKNGVLFYDELSTLTNKAGIEGSSLNSRLLSLYESALFQNLTKVNKDQFTLQPRSYCASLIACCTDKNFQKNWSRLAGESTGLDDRFFFLLQPEILKDVIEFTAVSTYEASPRTRKLIDAAVVKEIYEIDASVLPLRQFLKESDNNRAEIRAEKFALYFAVDLGLDVIDDECIERGLALVRYEMAVKKYLQTYEAYTKEGSLQTEIIWNLRKHKGVLDLRKLERIMQPLRYGMGLWSQAYSGLIKSGYCREEGDPKKLILMCQPEEEDE